MPTDETQPAEETQPAHEAEPARPSGDADKQLAAIAQVSESLSAALLDHWLFGGWAVDFWVGRRTRTHDDVDLAVWQSDREAIHRVLTSSGWRHTPLAGEVEGTRYRSRDGVLLELTFLVAGKPGGPSQASDSDHVLIAMHPVPVVWSTIPFGEGRLTLDGVTCRVLPFERMVADKSQPRTDPEDAAKDIADHEALRAHATARR